MTAPKTNYPRKTTESAIRKNILLSHVERKWSRMSNYLVIISLVVFLLYSVFTLCYLLGGLDGSLLWVKLKSMLLLRSLRFLFCRLLGWEVPLILLLCLVSGLGDRKSTRLNS